MKSNTSNCPLHSFAWWGVVRSRVLAAGGGTFTSGDRALLPLEESANHLIDAQTDFQPRAVNAGISLA